MDAMRSPNKRYTPIRYKGCKVASIKKSVGAGPGIKVANSSLENDKNIMIWPNKIMEYPQIKDPEDIEKVQEGRLVELLRHVIVDGIDSDKTWGAHIALLEKKGKGFFEAIEPVIGNRKITYVLSKYGFTKSNGVKPIEEIEKIEKESERYDEIDRIFSPNKTNYSPGEGVLTW